MKIQLRKQKLQKRLLQQQKTSIQNESPRDNFKSFAVSANQKRSNPFVR